MDLPPAVYVPVAGALVGALGALWAAWKGEREGRASDNKDHTTRYERLVRDVLEQEQSEP